MSADAQDATRSVHKPLRFTPAEWDRVQRRMKIVGARTFAEFARTALLDGQIKVNRIAFDPAPLRTELSRIGNNINQIARHVNTEDYVTLDEMHATRELLMRVQQAITDATKADEV